MGKKEKMTNNFKIIKFSYYKMDGLFWFRWFGYGLLIKNIKKHPLIFSQRIGKKGKVIKNIYLEILKKISLDKQMGKKSSISVYKEQQN